VGVRAGLVALAGTLLLLVPFAGLEPRAGAALASPSVAFEATHTTTATSTSTTVSTRTSTAVNDEPQERRDHHDMDDTLPAKLGGRLVLDLDTGGSVEIRGWDRNEVHVHAQLAGADWRSTQLAIGPEPFGVAVRAIPTGYGHSQSTSHSFEIQVPRRYDVRLRSAGGSISISGVEGTFEGSTGGGEIQLENTRGRASLITGGGDIEVSDCDLMGSVSTGGGTVKLSRVKGGLRGSSGSGPVVYAESTDDEGTGDLTRRRRAGSARVDADLDRRERKFRSRLRSPQHRGPGSSGRRRRSVRDAQQHQFRKTGVQQQHRSGDSRRLGDTSIRLGPRRVGPAATVSRRVGGGRILPAVAE